MIKTISVFGSSQPREGDAEFNAAYLLGTLLAQKGFRVCTGGYQGVMNAVSKGAYENKGQTIGVMVNFWNSTPSPYLSQKIECTTLIDRVLKLIELGDAYVVLRGGTGTLLELSAAWELMNKGLLQKKPIVCHSSLWRDITSLINKQLEHEGRPTGLIKYIDKIEDIADYLEKKLI